MEDPREVVEKIRTTKFDVGASRKNPLAEEYHEAIRQLSACIYQNDLHFIMELVQNADDNEYRDGVEPELDFVLVEEDVADVGVELTLLVLNNEIGFSRDNVEHLCSIGRSTKKGRRDQGYIGEKGIGFKSVFLVTRNPIVISNGYRIRFRDCPTEDADLGFIVPEWSEQPTDADLSRCLGVGKEDLPTTIIVLPIRQDKAQVMREQFFQLSSQLVLFLNKIDKLSARMTSRVMSPEASNERNYMSVQRNRRFPTPEVSSMVPESCSYSIVNLSSAAREETFHVWKQEFPVEGNHDAEDRGYIKSWMVTIAFPFNHRSNDGSEPNLYAYLPMKLATGLPFIVNADFMLVSSRDSLLFDSLWNRGILRCIPQAFISALMFLLKSGDLSPSINSLQDVYHYIPISHVSQVELVLVRETILWRLRSQNCILCDRNVGQQFPSRAVSDLSACFFCQPSLARTVASTFRLFLEEMHSMQVSPPQLLSSERLYIVDDELQKEFEKVLPTLGVKSFTTEEYLECLRSPGWLMTLPDELYVKLLLLLSTDLVKSEFLIQVPLIKYVDDENEVRLLAPCDKDKFSVHISKNHKDMPILAQWTPIFQQWLTVLFMPNSTIKTANYVLKDKIVSLCDWLKTIAGVNQLSVKSYATKLVSICKKLRNNAPLALGIMHFVLHAIHNGYLSEDKCRTLILELPLVDHSGEIHSSFKGSILLPASVCKWPRFLQQRSWHGQVLCLSEEYLELPSFMNDVDSTVVLHFLRRTIKAVDIFDIENPPDAPLLIPSPWGLAQNDAKSMLSWLKELSSVPIKLKTSLQEKEWVKTMEHGEMKPHMTFLDVGQWNNIFTSGDMPFVDTRFYGNLKPFTAILNELGVVTRVEDGAKAVADHVQTISKAHTLQVQTAMACKWYKYLCMNNWIDWRNQNMQIVWVPRGEHQHCSGSWKRPNECVISDKGGLFHRSLCVLDLHYKDDRVLKFFKDNVGVPEKPGTVEHCRLWLDQTVNRTKIGKDYCYNTWCMIANGWASAAKEHCSTWQDFCKRCQIPCESLESSEGSGELCLGRPSEVLYADNLILAEIVQQTFPSLKFSWYPRSADAASWVDELVRCYSNLGVRQLSDAVVGGVPKQLADEAVNGGPPFYEGKIGRGLYMAILGYLADPKLNVSIEARKRMVMQLKDVNILHVDKVGEVEYEVSIGGKPYAVSRAGHVRWEKGKKQIFVTNSGICNRAQLAHEFASEVAKGVVGGERVLLVPGLQEFLLPASAMHFEVDSVQYLLHLRNLRLTLEDEAFLSNQQL